MRPAPIADNSAVLLLPNVKVTMEAQHFITFLSLRDRDKRRTVAKKKREVPSSPTTLTRRTSGHGLGNFRIPKIYFYLVNVVSISIPLFLFFFFLCPSSKETLVYSPSDLCAELTYLKCSWPAVEQNDSTDMQSMRFAMQIGR